MGELLLFQSREEREKIRNEKLKEAWEQYLLSEEARFLEDCDDHI